MYALVRRVAPRLPETFGLRNLIFSNRSVRPGRDCRGHAAGDRKARQHIRDWGDHRGYAVESLVRWTKPICPLVAGIPADQGEFILHRVS
ncbi:MAG: hypothetical protein ACREXP_19695, partial [Steroidobacteraceae bacterium]